MAAAAQGRAEQRDHVAGGEPSPGEALGEAGEVASQGSSEKKKGGILGLFRKKDKDGKDVDDDEDKDKHHHGKEAAAGAAGAAAGLLLGLPLNRLLGGAFALFNRFFDAATGSYTMPPNGFR